MSSEISMIHVMMVACRHAGDVMHRPLQQAQKWISVLNLARVTGVEAQLEGMTHVHTMARSPVLMHISSWTSVHPSHVSFCDS